MDFKFCTVPQSNSNVNSNVNSKFDETTAFKSSDLLEVISHATKQYLSTKTPYEVYLVFEVSLVFELSYHFSKQSFIFKKLFTINEKSIDPCISPDTDFVKL